MKKYKITQNSGIELYNKAKNIIPGGNMLLSKRPEMYLPEYWPSYYKKSKGIKIWDLDNNVFKDMSLMGVGTSTLGYSNKKVDKEVKKVIKNGVVSTLNCKEEVLLAEKLIEMNPWSGMVKFARSGGEANAIAVRIARAASGKDKIAICGYHGWHDWYLSVNHNNDSENNLSKHLLPGLNPNGVPKNLKNTVYPFDYNNYNQLEEIVKNNEIGVIKMEVIRNTPPIDDFLLKIRKLATKNNIVLIFDECTSGFRETYGGIYKKYNVDPDMVVYGKTIANGYALSCVVGKKNIMQYAQSTFISSTFWTERIGPAAAIKTLEIIKKNKTYDIITNLGEKMVNGWMDLSNTHKIGIKISGIPSLGTYSFDSENNLLYKTFITQEMLKHNIIGSTNFYPSIRHTERDINEYLDILNDIYIKIKKHDEGKINIEQELLGPICHNGFKRLN